MTQIINNSLHAGEHSVRSHKVNHGHNRSPKITRHCRLAWPVTVILSALLIKGKITLLIDRIKTIEGGGFKAEFRAGLKELEKIADPPDEDSKSYAYDSKTIQLQRLAGTSPNGAIVDPWREVELASISGKRNNNPT